MSGSTFDEVDASDIGVGAVWSQRSGSPLKPRPFFSRRLSPTEKNYEVGDRSSLLLSSRWRMVTPARVS